MRMSWATQIQQILKHATTLTVSDDQNITVIELKHKLHVLTN